MDLQNEIAIQKNNLITSGFYVPDLYEISFDLKLTAAITGGVAVESIIHGT